MDVVYEIAKWKEVFENSESRKLKTLNWISVPVGFGSGGYQTLLEDFGAESPAIYGAWIALAQVAATRPVRGVLANSRGQAMKVSHIARMTGFDVELMTRMIEWASSEDVGWLVPHEAGKSEENTGVFDNPEASGESPDDIPERREKVPNEGKGREQQGTEKNSAAAASCLAAAAEVDFFVGLDLSSVRDQAITLRAACSRLDRDFVWRSCAIGMAIDREMIPEIVRRIRAREIAKPEPYIDKILREEVEKRGGDYRDVKRRAPPTPAPATQAPAAATEASEPTVAAAFKPVPKAQSFRRASVST